MIQLCSLHQCKIEHGRDVSTSWLRPTELSTVLIKIKHKSLSNLLRKTFLRQSVIRKVFSHPNSTDRRNRFAFNSSEMQSSKCEAMSEVKVDLCGDRLMNRSNFISRRFRSCKSVASFTGKSKTSVMNLSESTIWARVSTATNLTSRSMVKEPTGEPIPAVSCPIVELVV